MQIQDCVIVITGGASGIGESAAKFLSEQGAKIVLGDMNEKELKRVVAEIGSKGGNVIGMVCDVTKEDQVRILMDGAIRQFGRINVVFANAGIIKDSLMINMEKESGKIKSVMSLEAFKSVVDVNLIGAFLTLREGAKRMVEQGTQGLLLVTTSINKAGQVGQLNYSSTKAAVALWPKILSAEFHMKGIKNIRTAAIAPGYTATPILREMNQDALSAILKDVHVGRLIETDEISKTIEFIIQNEAIDGTCIEVTGGLTYGPRAIVK